MQIILFCYDLGSELLRMPRVFYEILTIFGEQDNIDSENMILINMRKQREQEGQEMPFILNSFLLSYRLKGHFPAL